MSFIDTVHSFSNAARAPFRTAWNVAVSAPHMAEEMLHTIQPPKVRMPKALQTVWRGIENNKAVLKPKPLPSHWEHVPFKVGDESIRCVHAPVRGCEDPIYAILGLKDSVEYNVNFIRVANRMGRSVVVLELPDPGDEIGYMDFYREIGEKFLITDAPLASLYKYDRRHNLSHSTGGHIELHHLMDEAKAREISDNSVSSTFVSPFGTAPFATKKHLNVMYRQYARRVAKKRYGDTIPDRIHALKNHLRGHPPLSSREKRLTHEQVLYMVDQCSPLLSEISNVGLPSAALERMNSVVVGKKDYVSAPKANTDIIAKALGVEPSVHNNGWHAPHSERTTARRVIDKHMRTASEKARQEQLVPERIETPLEHIMPFDIPGLKGL